MYYKTQNYDLIFTPVNYLPATLQTPRPRSDVLAELKQDSNAYEAFQKLTSKEQEAFLEFCVGNRGLKVTYDPFFQKVLSPTTHPERLNSLISAILGVRVTIKRVLPREGIHLADGSSLMIMDILVELEDSSLVNVEIQRHGLYFPMQRSSCYGSDLLVRQYAQLRDLHGKSFSYQMMRPIYIIVLMESSPKEFHKHPATYLHRSRLNFDSGLELENLMNFIYIPLDIFKDIPHNDIGELEAWLYFLSSDNPVHIQKVLERYPAFAALYKEIINFRYNPKELIYMFSEALAIMDRNTEKLMIDEMKKEVENLQEKINSLNTELSDVIAKRDNAIAEKDNAIAEKDNAIAEKDAKIEHLLKLLNMQETKNLE